LSVAIPEDSLSDFVKKVGRSSSGASSATATPSSVDSRKSSRKCSACDYYGNSPIAVDARKRRGVFIVTARQLIKK